MTSRHERRRCLPLALAAVMPVRGMVVGDTGHLLLLLLVVHIDWSFGLLIQLSHVWAYGDEEK